MKTFSTVLFVQQTPVGYTVQRTDDRIQLNPAENPQRTIHPPTLVAEKKGGGWIVRGTLEHQLIRQVLDEIDSLAPLADAGALSAAP